MTDANPNAYTHHHLSAERLIDKYGPAIMLTQQDDCYDPITIVAHPWQFRAICEEFGIIDSDPRSLATIETQARRIRLMAHRFQTLADLVGKSGDITQHAILEARAYAQASAELAAEYSLDSGGAASPPLAETLPEQFKQGALL